MNKQIGLTIILSSAVLVLGLEGAMAQDYKPTNKVFWSETEAALKESNFDRVLRQAKNQLEDVKKDSLEASEAHLAQAMALRRRGVTFGATILLSDIIKNKLGTEVAGQALREVEEVVKTGSYDDYEVIGELINDMEFETLPAGVNDFVMYQQGLFNLIKGFNQWSSENFKKITKDSYWDFKFKYMNAIGDVAQNRVDQAIEKFSGIANSVLAPDDIRTEANHQYARLLFEKGDYPQAYKIFKQVKLSPREKGLILLERAWAKYYQKDYSKALGLLAALEAPMFDTARSPEPYILRMVMFKELCQYDAAFETLKEYNARFAAPLKNIRRRRDLRRDHVIVSLSLLDHGLQRWVNFLNALREERQLLNELSWGSFEFYKPMKTQYDLKIKEVEARLSWMLRDKVRDTANQLIDWQEQMTFLDYQTRLDSLRVIKPQSETYSSQDVPHLSFDKIYWVNTGEHWLDELEDYRYFINSRCADEGSGL